MAEEKTKDQAVVSEAAKAFGIGEKFILASAVRGDVVTIVTVGGTKVSWKKGDKVEPLDPIRVDGVIRKKMKPITGAKK